MKKTIAIKVMLFSLFLVSCSETDISINREEEITLKTQSSMFEYVKSIRLENEIQCEKNILVFPSWELYYDTIDALDELTENYCDAFDANISPNLTDDEYDAFCDAQGFDEDDIIVQFENELEFCSLRKKITEEEDVWLGLQGDGDWNINEDPDNHFIDEETERALLSENSEVMIGDDERGYTYYRFIDDKGSVIVVYNEDMQAIIAVSTGSVPTGNPNVEVVVPRKVDPPAANCKGEIKEIEYIYNQGSRIKRKSKIMNTSSWGPKKIGATTVGYKKKNGKWKRRRTWITAGLTDYSGSGGGKFDVDCNEEFDCYHFKNKRRRKVKVKERQHTYYGSSAFSLTVTSGKLYGIHRQGSIDFAKDYYEMSEY